MKFAVVRIRGVRKINPKIKKTMELLMLQKSNHCVIIEDSPQNKGMLEVAKDYIAYGPIEESTLYNLIYKRGKRGRSRISTLVKEDDIKKITKDVFSGKKIAEFMDPVFTLTPPSKGHKNIKKNYPEGDLGKRMEMDTLLKKMI